MSKGIVIATTDVKLANRDERVVDSRSKGSWKIVDRLNVEFSMTNSGSTVTREESVSHDLGFVPAYIAMVEADTGLGTLLYNIPLFDSSISCKVMVTNKTVRVTAVLYLVTTIKLKFKILLLGEKIE